MVFLDYNRIAIITSTNFLMEFIHHKFNGIFFQILNGKKNKESCYHLFWVKDSFKKTKKIIWNNLIKKLMKVLIMELLFSAKGHGKQERETWEHSI